jgi:hypothetical protein
VFTPKFVSGFTWQASPVIETNCRPIEYADVVHDCGAGTPAGAPAGKLTAHTWLNKDPQAPQLDAAERRRGCAERRKP